jgi:hypothetical protein
MTGQMFKCFMREGRRGEKRMRDVFVIFQTQIYMDLHRLDVVYITQFIYFNSHGSTPHTTTEYNFPNTQLKISFGTEIRNLVTFSKQFDTLTGNHPPKHPSPLHTQSPQE